MMKTDVEGVDRRESGYYMCTSLGDGEGPVISLDLRKKNCSQPSEADYMPVFDGEG